jgi:ArsR family transcriptional regulator
MKEIKCDDKVFEDGVLPTADDEELARLAQALGHPARVAIVRLLKQKQVCVCGEIVEKLPLAQSTVSQHLKVLKDAGWVKAQGNGVRVCYSLDENTLQRCGALIQLL